jgi:hypothetical protein
MSGESAAEDHRARIARGGRWWFDRALGVLAAITLVGIAWTTLRQLFAPLLADPTRLGVHDWDTHTAHRWLPILSLREYHEGPWWSPWFCGGYASWGYSESAASLVSPFFPAYYFLPIGVALRVEIVGTTLLSLVGTWLAAGRHTKSFALRALAAVLFALNGRWALQTASGHAWHLYYAYTPFALWLLEKSIDERRPRLAALGGVFLALMVYAGGIYPVPHTALVLVVVAAVRAYTGRSARPLASLALMGSFSLLFSAPKLLPVMDTMSRAPRLIESTEAMDPMQAWAMLTEHSQHFGWYPPSVHGLPYGWHEWGAYVGVPGVLVLVGGLVLRGDARSAGLRVGGILFLVLSFGAFGRYAPWTLLHKLPVFSSQHVPSRFLQPAILLLSLAFAASVGRRLRRVLERHRWVDLLLLAPVAWIASDIASVSGTILADTFTHEDPVIVRAPEFTHARVPSVGYRSPDWAPPVYLAMRANTGVIDCWAVPQGFPKGAVAKGAEGYRGEAWVAEGSGTARVVAWTPNSAVLEVKDASPGALVVYNMNWDPSWFSDAGPVIEWNHAPAVRLPAGGEARVTLRYRPRTLWAGVLLAALAAALVLAWPSVERRALTLRDRFRARLTAARA